MTSNQQQLIYLFRDNNRDLNRIANADLAVPGYTAQGTPGKALFSWNMTTTPQEFLSNRVVGLGQGTGIGGGSIVNGMVWTRGARSDFDAWAALGNTGWGWDDLLPYFKKVLRTLQLPSSSPSKF